MVDGVKDLPSTLERVKAFLDRVQQDHMSSHGVTTTVQGVELRWSDVEMLWAIVSAAENSEHDGRPKAMAIRDFLNSADRAVKGWQRANKNQIETIGRLQALCQEQDRQLHEAEEWQNQVASLIPEDAEGINPEGAQEGIIIDYMKHLIAENQRLNELLSGRED